MDRISKTATPPRPGKGHSMRDEQGARVRTRSSSSKWAATL